MAMRAKWTVRVQQLQTRLRVGVHEHERHPQPVSLSLKISGLADTAPTSLAPCFDHEPILRWALEEWPQSPHTPLLETRLNELVERVFNADKRIMDVWFGLYKTQAVPQAEFVGLEREITRRQFEEQQRSRSNGSAQPHPPGQAGRPASRKSPRAAGKG